MAGKKKTYTPQPKVPKDLEERFRTMLMVMGGQISVAEGARRLKMSRNHFQTLMHRGLEGLIEGISPGSPGRPARSEKELELERENEQLRKMQRKLEDKLETVEQLMMVTGELIRGRGRGRKRKPRTGTGDEEDEPRERLEKAGWLRGIGVGVRLVACAIGVGVETYYRWMRRRGDGDPLVERRGPGPNGPPDEQKVEQVSELVRESNGLIGAEALSRSVDGVSRRQAACIKKTTRTEMERERKQQTIRVHVPVPGVIRGLDQLFVGTTQGRRVLLIGSDGAVPYRTSASLHTHYDEDAVHSTVLADIEEHGPPLVWRWDRYSAHRTAKVCRALEQLGVLVLHGPARLARFYGQTEHQNEEHRAFLDAEGILSPSDFSAMIPVMLNVLNTKWKRRTLGWRTAEEAWGMRPRLDIDRHELREEVMERASRIRMNCDTRDISWDLAQRLAIEQALTQRGLLKKVKGGWC